MMFLSAFSRRFLILLILAFSLPVQGAERAFTLSAPQNLIKTGFLQYLLPRFALKHGIRIELSGDAFESNAAFTMETHGSPLIEGPEGLWYLHIEPNATEPVQRFAEWLRSDIGIRTIEAYEIEGRNPFSAPDVEPMLVSANAYPGDPILGAEVSRKHCARCHVVRDDDWMNAIGSTPSFFALRTLVDWELRFAGFYTLNPHPAFTRIENVTAPFDPNRPPPIVPLEITLDELDALIAYVAGLTPADLGAAIEYQ